jgi:hypothetical protein
VDRFLVRPPRDTTSERRRARPLRAVVLATRELPTTRRRLPPRARAARWVNMMSVTLANAVLRARPALAIVDYYGDLLKGASCDLAFKRSPS